MTNAIEYGATREEVKQVQKLLKNDGSYRRTFNETTENVRKELIEMEVLTVTPTGITVNTNRIPQGYFAIRNSKSKIAMRILQDLGVSESFFTHNPRNCK